MKGLNAKSVQTGYGRLFFRQGGAGLLRSGPSGLPRQRRLRRPGPVRTSNPSGDLFKGLQKLAAVVMSSMPSRSDVVAVLQYLGCDIR